jgi:GAF domain-containing protein
MNRSLRATETTVAGPALLKLLEGQLAACSPSQAFAVLSTSLALAIPYQVLAIYRREGDRLIPEFLHGAEREQFASLAIPLGMGLAGWVAENHKGILNGNPSVEPGYLADPSKFSTLSSALAVPLDFPGGPCGVLSLYRRDRDAFRSTDLNTLQSIAGLVGRALQPVPEAK